MSTIDNLKAAFAGESQANRKYTAFARKADEEGYPQVARLFRAVAYAETVHALNHLRVLGDVKTTAENLQAAMAGENYEHTIMYPEFIAEAEKAGNKAALRTFNHANEVEKVHEELYKQAADTLGTDGDTYEFYVCPVCGYTHARSAPDKCPVCGLLGSKFEKIA